MPSKIRVRVLECGSRHLFLIFIYKGVVVAQSNQKGIVAYWLGAAFSAVGSGSVVGFCLQEWFGAHRFETWRESYIWIYWIMVLSTVAGALIGLYSYSFHRKREGW